MRSATRLQENRNTSAMPSTSTAIPSSAEPVNPSQCTASGPPTAPTMPPAEPGSASSHRYRRDHSSPVLATSSSASPTQKAARVDTRRDHTESPATAATGAPPCIQRQTPPHQTRITAATHHHAEKPSSM